MLLKSNNKPVSTDKSLVSRSQNGEREAFAQLVKRHQSNLMNYIIKMTRDMSLTEDIVQEAMLKAYLKIGTFQGKSSFKSWLFRIGINTAKNKLRATKRISVNIDDVNLSITSEVENNLYKEKLKGCIESRIEYLPHKQKHALMLRIFEDMSFKEIADIMNSPYDTAKANYRHALLKLRESIKGDELFKEWFELLDRDRGAELVSGDTHF